jgi:hypothetical protein
VLASVDDEDAMNAAGGTTGGGDVLNALGGDNDCGDIVRAYFATVQHFPFCTMQQEYR